jgi:hypothetical protein
MSNTPLLNLPYLAAGQAQKHVTLNESLRMLDALVQLVAESRTIATPPGSPAEGARYLVPTAPAGAWATHSGQIAAFQDGGWSYHTPKPGWFAWVVEESQFLVFDGSVWQAATGATSSLPKLGINATADTTNRLTVSAPATLLDHAGAGHQLKINKAAATSTGSILFQTGYSGRAEIGLCGNDALAVKYASDGQNWATGLTISLQGQVGIGTTAPGEKLDVTGNIHANGSVQAGQGDHQTTVNPGAVELCSNVYGPYFDWKQSAAQDYLWRTMLSGTNFEFIAKDGATDRFPLRLSNKGAIMLHDTWVGTANQVMVTQGDPNLPAQWKSLSQLRFSSYSKSALPSAGSFGAGAVIYVPDESGGAVLAFSDGGSWRRVTDRAVVS